MIKDTRVKLAVFDFDETLTDKDTTLFFLNYYAGAFKTWMAFILNLPELVLAMRGIVEWKNVKERVFTHVFAGHTPEMIAPVEKRFAEVEIPAMLIESVWYKLTELRKNGYRIVLLSASCSIWLKQWCERENIHLLCTELEIVDGKFTGKIAGNNCYGPEKVNRLKQAYNISEAEHIVAFGNHKSDFYYMDLAHEAYLVKGDKLIKYEPKK